MTRPYAYEAHREPTWELVDMLGNVISSGKIVITGDIGIRDSYGSPIIEKKDVENINYILMKILVELNVISNILTEGLNIKDETGDIREDEELNLEEEEE